VSGIGLIVKRVAKIKTGVVQVVNTLILKFPNILAFVINVIIHHFYLVKFLIHAVKYVKND
jgi:hypothetical protein